MQTSFPKIDNLTSTVTLNNGSEMPILGMGTWQLKEGNECQSSVRDALEIGYRHLDTAAIYENEKSVGQAVNHSGIDRGELFITTKLWNDAHGKDQVAPALDNSLKRLGLDYVDLYLIHWPCGMGFMETWHAMEKLLDTGKTKAIGVSNFLEPHLQTLLADCAVKPAVNQVEFHPWLVQPSLHAYLREQEIVSQAWSPIMQGRFGEVAELKEIAQQHGKSPVQVLLRWDLQHGVVTIPKSSSRQHLESNAQVFDFELSDEEMSRINALDRHERLGPDPFTFPEQ